MKDRRRAAILAEIDKYTGIPPMREEYQITAREFGEQQGCTPETAKRRLERLEHQGILLSEERSIGKGHIAQVWWRPEDAEREVTDG